MVPEKFEYESFELLIGMATSGGYPVTVIESPAGETESSLVYHLDADDGQIQYGLKLVAAGNADAELLTALGSELFSQLFRGPIATLFRSSLAMLRGQRRHLRVRLRIEPPELHTLPWELLHDPDEKVNLAVAADMALVRHFPQRIPVRPTTVQPPLRLLVAISTPRAVALLDVEKEKAIIQSALGSQDGQQKVMVQFLDHATPATLTEALRAFQPHVFHFIGHGAYEHGRAYALLEDETGGPNLIDEISFGELFASGKETRLVVLNACQSATPVDSRSLTGLAPSLLQRQVSAVVAMQYPISDAASLVFARHFYHSLASGLPVDMAISEARRSIFVEIGGDHPDWAAPVLYLRAKNGEIFAVAEPTQAKPLDIPAPPAPATPPVVPDFVGREMELAGYRAKLNESGIAVIAGMPGVGKTALAAQLAAGFAEAAKVFWHSVRVDEGVDVLIWKLAGFLAWHGHPSVWQMLQGIVLGGGQMPPSDVLIDYIFQSIKGQGYLICFDDFHIVEKDPLFGKLADHLRPAILAGEVRLLIASQQLPDFVLVSRHTPLGGLAIADARRLLAVRMVTLDDSLFAELYTRTEGNAELLVLAIHVLQGGAEAKDIVNRLVRADDVKRYLLSRVDQDLNDEERATMNGVAVLLGYPGTCDAIEEVLDGRNVRRTLTYLINRYLLQALESPTEREYFQHGIVQGFYYDLLSRRERRAMHQRAAGWYELEGADPFRAALHYQYAGDSAKAGRLATEDVWALINLGHSAALNKLLQLFQPRQLDPELWLEVKLAQGQVFAFCGESEQARACYREVLSQAAAQADDAGVRAQRVRAYRGLGELLQQETPQEALTWLQQGLEANAGVDPRQEAGLYVAIGTIHMWLGNYREAAEALLRGIDGLAPGPSQLRATALENLGVVAVEDEGNVEKGIAYTLDALQIAQQLHDHFKMAEILTTLGSYRFNGGDWPGALADLRQALALAQQIGSDKALAFAEITLGSIGIDAEQDDEAAVQAHLETGLRLAQKTHQSLDECVALMNLGELHIRLGHWQAAGGYLDRAEALIVQLGDRHYMPIILYGRAQVKLALQESQAALQDAMGAVALAREVSEAIELGIALRVLGQTHDALGQRLQAQSFYAESATTLADLYPYELARTQAHWAVSLLASGDAVAGNHLKQAATVTFQAFGARRDLVALMQ